MFIKPILKVTSVTAGAVTGVELQSFELAPTGIRLNTNGTGFTNAGAKSTTKITGTGDNNLTISIAYVHNDLTIGGEKWEYWRMINPSNPTGSGLRQGYIDASFPGTPLTIDTSGATYTFPVDRPL